MKKKIISLLLAFLMIVTASPLPALAQNAGTANEELEKLDYKYESVGGNGNIKITLPANSVEIVEEPEDPYAMRLMSITDNVPDKGGAGHLINWGTGVVWNVYDKNDPNKLAPFPPTGKKPYEVKLMKTLNGAQVVIGKVTVDTATEFVDDIKPNKPTTYQFVTTENYEVGDENKELTVEFPVELDMNLLYQVAQTSSKGTIGDNHKYNLIFLVVTRLTSPTYTAEWDKTPGALQPNVKGKLITGINKVATFDVFKEDGKYGTICNKPPIAYVDENDKAGKIIGEIRYDKRGSLDIKSVLWSKGSTPVMKGQFLSYSKFENGANVDKPLGNTKGQIPGFTETKFDYTSQSLQTSKYPAYFYNLVGDNDHMWRFQMKEGLELKFNTGVGSATQGGQTGQDIGNTQTVAYGEKFDSTLKGSFSENTLTLPETTNLVAPTLNKNNLKMKFIGWKLVQGLEVPVNPQKVETDGDGKQTLTAVTPDYADKAALETALKAADFKGFTEKNPVFYAIYGQTQGKANIKYVDDKGAVLAEDLKIQGQDYKTEKLGELNEAVTANINEAPEFKDYAISKVEIEPTTDAKYVDPATATIKFVYKAKATTDDKSSDQDYIKVTFNANGGHFGTETEKTKDVYVLKEKATFADSKGKVSNPTKDNAFFKEWQTAATGGTKVADEKTLSTADETFYASYTTKAQGKASVEYLDVKTGQAIADKYRSEDAAKYPAEKEGNQGTIIPADVYTKTTAPKFVGYECNRVEISPKDGTYALPATSTIKVYYNKLADVVPGTGNTKPDGYVTVKFEPGINGTLTGETTFYVNPKVGKTNADITEPTIKANTGFKVADSKWDPAFVAATEIKADATYTAQYTEIKDVVNGHDENGNVVPKPDGYKTVTFDLDGKGTTENETVFYVNPEKAVTLTAPKVKGVKGYTIKEGKEAWNPELPTTATKYAEDKTFVAQYTFSSVSDTEVEGFNKVTFKPGDHGTLAEKSVWVQPNTLVDISDKAPIVTANTGYSHIGWKPGLIGKFDNNSEVVAQYSSSISNEPIPGWKEILFNSGEHGRFDNGTRNVVWVDPDKEVDLSYMTARIIPYINYSFDKWTDANGDVDLSVVKKYADNAEFTGTYKSDISKTPEAGKVEINFVPGAHGKFADGAKTKIYVTEGKEVDLTEFAPTVIPNQGYGHSGWVPALKGTFTQATDITAQYKPGTFNKDKVKEIIVLGPNKMGYGVGEKLDLTGLKVIAIDDAGLQETYDGVDAIKTAGFNIDPADKTVLKMDDNGKHIVVTKGVDPNKVTGQSQTTLTIHENKSAKAEDVKALNQNKVVDGKVTDQPKDTTTVTGKAPAGSTVIIKDDAGNEIGKVDKVPANGEFTAEVTKQDEGKKVQVIVTEEGKQPSDPADAIVARDADNNNENDKSQDFDIKKVEKLEIVKQPKLKYTAKDKKDGETKFKLDLKDMVIRLTDKAGKEKLVIVKEDGKFYDYDVQTKEITELSATPAHGTKLTPETSATEKGDSGKKIKITGPNDKFVETNELQVFYDANGDDTPDYKEGQKTQTPSIMARNIGKDPKVTTVEGLATPGAIIKITDKDGKAITTEPAEIVAGPDGKYTATISPKLADGTEIKATAKLGEMAESDPAVTTVFKDVNNDRKPDGGKVDLTDVKEIQVIAPKKMSYTQGEKLDGTGLKAVITDNKSGIEIFDYDNATGKFKDADGKAVDAITATVNGSAIKDLALTKKDHNGKAIDVKVGTMKGSTNQTLEVKQLQTPTPTDVFAANQNTVGSDGVTPTQTEKAKTTVKFTVVNKPTTVYVKYTDNGKAEEESFDIGANDDATKTVDLQVKLPEGAVVQVLAKDADKTLSEAAIVTVVRDANNDGKADTKYLPAPTINPIKDKQATISGEAKDAETVDIYKKNKTTNEWELIKENENVSKDKFSYTNPSPFNDGDEIKVVAKRPNYVSAEATTTVGVDTSGLDKAIQDGKDALDPEKGGKNTGTPEDKTLEDAIKKGEEEKNKKPPKQEDVDKAQKDIEKAIEDKKAADDARDKLQEKIDEAKDLKNDPEYPTKPKDVKDGLDKAATDGQTTHDDKTKTKEDIDKAIKEIQDKIDEYHKQQIGVNIDKVFSTGKDIKVIVTAPNAKVEVFKSEVDWTSYQTILTPLKEATSRTRIIIVTLNEPLPSGTNLFIKVTHPDYLSYEGNVTVE